MSPSATGSTSASTRTRHGLELEVVYGTLYRRIPTLKLAVPADHSASARHAVNGL